MFAHLIKQYATYNLRFGMLLFAITWTFFGNAQQWQEFESISFDRYSRPLVNVVKDGKQYYYHLESSKSSASCVACCSKSVPLTNNNAYLTHQMQAKAFSCTSETNVHKGGRKGNSGI